MHGSPKLGASTNVSPRHRLHYHSHHHLHHSRVQSLDLMDDLPLPFQTDSHHLGILNQETPMLSPNPPPSVIDSQNLIQINTTQANQLPNLASNTTTSTNLLNSNLPNNQNNLINSTTTTTNVIINNIKTNTTTIGTTNPESGIVHQLSTAICDDLDNCNKIKKKGASKNHWRTCPELHKAMDGVTYIADHTKKEEESTRVSQTQ